MQYASSFVCFILKIITNTNDRYVYYLHTYVPEPDGMFGYGGKCFPKDVNAFAMMTKGTPLGTLLEHLHKQNVHSRGFEEHI